MRKSLRVPLILAALVASAASASAQQVSDPRVPAEPGRSAAIGGVSLDELTAREHEVLELVAQGLDNDAIGKQLHISMRTARNHVSLILPKIGAKSRAQAIVRARDAGFGKKTAG